MIAGMINLLKILKGDKNLKALKVEKLKGS